MKASAGGKSIRAKGNAGGNHRRRREGKSREKAMGKRNSVVVFGQDLKGALLADMVWHNFDELAEF